MAFDYTQLNSENVPARWALSAKYMRENDPDQMDDLDDVYKNALNKIYNEDLFGGSLPIVVTSLFSQTSTTATFNLAVLSPPPTTFDYDKNSKVWDGITPPADPASATTDIDPGDISSNKWTDTGPLTAGNHYAYVFDAYDGDGEGPISSSVEVIMAPAVPTGGSAAPGTNPGELDIDWDAMDGTATYTYYYLLGSGKTKVEVPGGEILEGHPRLPGVVHGTGHHEHEGQVAPEVLARVAGATPRDVDDATSLAAGPDAPAPLGPAEVLAARVAEPVAVVF